MPAAAGYGAIGGFGALYADAATVEVLAKGLAETRLTMPTAHFGLDLVERDPDPMMVIARRRGFGRIYCP